MKTIKKAGFSKLIDPHVHLLPGVDDGPPFMTAALEAAGGAAADGVAAAVCTPHLALGQYNNLRDTVVAHTEKLQSELDAAGIGLRVLPGCEALAHPQLPNLLAENKLPTLADRGRHVLLEIPWTVLPPGVPTLERLMYDLESQGVQLILAHPERYELVHKYPDWLRERVESGLLVQVNASHLLPTQRGTVGKTARALLENGLVHFLASDGHGSRHRPANLGSVLRQLAPEYGSTLVEQATRNAHAIIDEIPTSIRPIKV